MSDAPLSAPDALHRRLTPGRLSLHAKCAWHTLRTRGPRALARYLAHLFSVAVHGSPWRYYAPLPTRGEKQAQRRERWSDMPFLSVAVPLYNTPKKYLRQMIRSVRGQTYAKWELVLADGSDAAHTYVREVCLSAARDKRIRYTRIPKNGGIAENTNHALRHCEGDYALLLDHDDVLWPNALYEVAAAIRDTGAQLVYSDEIVLDEKLRRVVDYHFKPGFGPDMLRGCNYITHLCAFSYRLLESIGGGERAEFDGAQDYDLILRLSEKANHVAHIPKVLYAWRRHGGSTAGGIAQKPGALQAGARALADHLARVRLEGSVQPLEGRPGAYHIRYEPWAGPLVSVLIPNADHVDDLRRCLTSLYTKGGWGNMEVLVLDNNSSDKATEPYYQEAEERFTGLSVLRYPGPFNFSAICNFGAKRAKGEYLLLLNNDVEILSDGFVRELLSYSQRPDVGAVGAKLYYPDDTIQHAGLFIGLGGTAGVSHKFHPRGDGGDMFRLVTTQNVSAVTGAALMVRRDLYEQLGGLDEERFAVAFNDVDFCLRLREEGLYNVFTPFAEGIHFESKSRGYETDPDRLARFEREADNLRTRHAALFAAGDPFYSPHRTLQDESYALRQPEI